MLNAFKSELKRLSSSPDDPFHRKVRKRIGKRATGVLEERLRQIILIMPDLIQRTKYHWDRDDSTVEVKRIGSFLFAYLYHPQDFLDDKEHGLFGYLDDAYLTALIFEKVVSKKWMLNDEDYRFLEIVQNSKKYVKALIPRESEKIEEMVGNAISEGCYEKFAMAFGEVA